VSTLVYLKKEADADAGTEIIGIANETAYPVGSTAVDMRWLSPRKLDITSRSKSEIIFQAVKCGEVSISFHD
jgi:hypothetical protein